MDIAGIKSYWIITGSIHYSRPGVQGDSLWNRYSDTVISKYNFRTPIRFRLAVTNSSAGEDSILFFGGNAVSYQVAEADAGSRDTTAFLSPVRMGTSLSFGALNMTRIKLRPGETRIIIFTPELHYYNWYECRQPVLVRNQAVNHMAFDVFVQPDYYYFVYTIFFIGILITMLGYAFTRYWSTRLPEFLFYAMSGLCFVLYFGYQVLNNFIPSESYHSLDLFLKQFLQIGAHVFYMWFAVYLLNLRQTLPLLYKFIKILNYLLLAYLLTICFTSFSGRFYLFNITAFNLVRILLLVYSCFAIPLLMRHKDPLSRYVTVGALSVSLFAGIAFYYSNLEWVWESRFFYYFGGPITFFKIGILIDQVALILGLGQKVRREEAERIKAMESLQLDNEKKEIEKYMAVMETRDKERSRIAQEIHDDIGSGLTSIRLLSELAKARIKQEEQAPEVEKISATANELVENMNEIIWSINAKNDSLRNLVAYIRSYIVRYFESFDFNLHIHIPPEIPHYDINGEHRRNLFLVVKESLHNIVKHSAATRVDFSIEFRDGQMWLTIRDNGRGFAENEVKPYSVGLRSMRERMQHIGGQFSINGGNGTLTTLCLPLSTEYYQ